MSERSENLAYAAQLLAESGHRKNGPLYAGVMLSNGSIMILEIRSRRRARQPASRRLEEAVKSRGFGFASCTTKGEIFSTLGAAGALRSSPLTVEYAEAAE
jgi:hypothetical protein